MSEQEQTPRETLEKWLRDQQESYTLKPVREAIRAVLAEARRAEKFWASAQERAEKMEAERDALREVIAGHQAWIDSAPDQWVMRKDAVLRDTAPEPDYSWFRGGVDKELVQKLVDMERDTAPAEERECECWGEEACPKCGAPAEEPKP